MNRGAIIFAHNNSEIDYIKIAAANAFMIQENLDIGVTLVTDEGTLNWANESLGQELLDDAFEYIKLVDKEYVYGQTNQRVFRDTNHTAKHLQFYNGNHWMAYDLSPYDETLFIDADYLIMSDALNAVWGSENEFMINSDIQEVYFSRQQELNVISDFGIKLYWATCIYFRKTELSEHLFSLVKHVYDNYKYYRQLYLIPRGMFRNDFAFSIAVHMINGFVDNSVISQLPITAIYKSFDNDDILKVTSKNDMTLLLEKPERIGEFVASRFKGVDLHLMNKWAVLRQADELIKLYR